MLTTEESLLCAMPRCIESASQLRRVQHLFARPEGRALAVQNVPVTAAGNLVLAREVELEAAVLPAGAKLDWRQLPMLLEAGCRTVPVLAPLRCGLLTVLPQGEADARAAEAATVVIQVALERLGARVFQARGNAPSWRDASAIDMFAAFCDLTLVIGGAAQGGDPSCCGIDVPELAEIGGKSCVLLPGDPEGALGQFIAFVVPLLRGMQGGAALLPSLRCAVDVGEASARVGVRELAWVRTDGLGDSARVLACRPEAERPMRALAAASGIAWRAPDFAARHERAIVYLPFDEWL